MPRLDLNRLSDDAYAWIFGISPALDDSQQRAMLERVDAFLRDWAAHGTPIDSGREIRDGRFLVIAAEHNTERSGCSIDRLFGTLKQLEREFGVTILEPTRVFFRHGDGRIDALSRAEFREKGDAHTIVFDTTAETLGDIRSGAWERRAEESWHRQLLSR